MGANMNKKISISKMKELIRLAEMEGKEHIEIPQPEFAEFEDTLEVAIHPPTESHRYEESDEERVKANIEFAQGLESGFSYKTESFQDSNEDRILSFGSSYAPRPRLSLKERKEKYGAIYTEEDIMFGSLQMQWSIASELRKELATVKGDTRVVKELFNKLFLENADFPSKVRQYKPSSDKEHILKVLDRDVRWDPETGLPKFKEIQTGLTKKEYNQIKRNLNLLIKIAQTDSRYLEGFYGKKKKSDSKKYQAYMNKGILMGPDEVQSILDNTDFNLVEIPEVFYGIRRISSEFRQYTEYLNNYINRLCSIRASLSLSEDTDFYRNVKYLLLDESNDVYDIFLTFIRRYRDRALIKIAHMTDNVHLLTTNSAGTNPVIDEGKREQLYDVIRKADLSHFLY